MATGTRSLSVPLGVAANDRGVRVDVFAAYRRVLRMSPRTPVRPCVAHRVSGERRVYRLADQFDRRGRVVAPDARSWNLAGDVMGEVRRREPGWRGKIASLWNDALIALSGRQIGASIVTNNLRDFELLRRFVRFDLAPFGG